MSGCGAARTVDGVSDTPADVASVRVAAGQGRVRVVAEDRDDVAVTGDAAVQREGGRTTVDAGPNRVEVRVPTGTDLVVGTSSGRVDTEGSLGSVAVVTESGRVRVQRAEELDVRTANGRVEVERVDQCSRIRATNGRVTVERTSEADVATENGRIELRSVSGRTTTHCVNGRIEVCLDAAADVEAETVNGRITVRVPSDVTAHAVTGSLPSGPPPEGADCTIATRSVNGRVSVETA